MVLTVEHKHHLLKLKDLSFPTLKSVLENLKSFDVEAEEYQEVYNALLKLTIESHKLKLSNRDLLNLLKDELSFSEEYVKAICDYIKYQNDIFMNDNLRFVDLEWRVEAKIASRSIHSINPIEPNILLKINVDSENSLRYRSKTPSNQQIVMNTNATNLVHIINKLEQALIESKSLARK